MYGHICYIKRHSSYDELPNFPYFTKSRKKPSDKTISRGESSGINAPVALTALPASPGKRVKVRSECIDQLKKLHSLLGDGIITDADYEKITETILKDIV